MMKRRSKPRRSSTPTSANKKAAAPVGPPCAPRRRTRADREAAVHLLSVLKAGGDARKSKIKHVRQKVRARSYENELKLSIAIERMTRDLSA